jgi:hypothetical protein
VAKRRLCFDLRERTHQRGRLRRGKSAQQNGAFRERLDC